MAAAGAATLTVGTDLQVCDFTDLQTAIDTAASGDLLQIEASAFLGVPDVNFRIVSKSLTLEGGYAAGCTGTVTGNLTNLEGQGSASVLEIGGAGSGFSVTLRNLLLRDGGPDSDFGGGLEIDGDFDVSLDNVFVSFCSSERGGAIHLDGSAGATLFVERSELNHNTAVVVTVEDSLSGAGGGIFCTNQGSIHLRDGSEVNVNDARDGGGIWADGCMIEVDDASIAVNDVTRDGAGVFLTGGAELDLEGETFSGAAISSNRSGFETGGRGGGAYLEGPGTTLSVVHARVDRNGASFGGGIYARDQAQVSFGPSPPSCQQPHCQRFIENFADQEGAGAWISEGAEVTFSGAHIFRNSVGDASPGGSVAFLDSGAELEIVNSVIQRNTLSASAPGASGIFSNDVSNLIKLSDSTWNHEIEAGSLFSGSGTLDIDNAIFWELSDVVFGPAWIGPIRVDCAILPPGEPVPFGATEISSADPLFVAEDDVHLRVGSPAIDLCSNSTSTSFDFENEPRPVGAAHDAGADEAEVPVFTDDFETGDLSGWSASVP